MDFVVTDVILPDKIGKRLPHPGNGQSSESYQNVKSIFVGLRY